MDYVHSPDIQWAMPLTQSGDLMDYAHTVWRSDGLCTHSLEIRWTMHTDWRSDGLYTQSLEINGLCTRPGDQVDYAHNQEIGWAMHIPPGEPINCVYTNRRSAGYIHVRKVQMTLLQCVCAVTNAHQ